MVLLARSYYKLLLMRLPPQAFPVSGVLFATVLLAFAAVSVLNHWLVAGSVMFALARAGLSIINLCAGAALILLLANRASRWQQTATALLGGSALLGMLLLPILMVYALGIQNIFIHLSMLMFNIWELIFFGHVYRNALDTGMSAGIAVALIYLIVSILLKETLLPFPGGSA